MRTSLCPVIATMEEKLDDITKCLTEMFSVNAATNTKLGMLSSRLEGLEKNVGTQGGVKLDCNLGLSSMNGDIMASRHLDHDYGASNGIGGSRGGREGRTPPPGRPNSFNFMQFSGKFGVFTPPLEGSRPPLGKILDPPLNGDEIGKEVLLNYKERDGKSE